MKPRLNHRQLEAFRAVIESGSVTGAAERLFITQPAVSRLIQDLEAAVGFKLFHRRHGRLDPTVEAKVLFDEVERSFVGLDKILNTAEDIRTFRAGTLRIAAMPATALGLLPRVIARFQKIHPEVQVSLQIRSSVRVLEWLASQQFDLGFAALRHSHPGVEQALLIESPYVAVLPAGHRLARRAVLEPADFAGENFISVGEEIGARSLINEIFEAAGVERRTKIDTQLASAICQLVAEGAGLSLVEPITAWEYRHLGVVARPFRPALFFRHSLLMPALRPPARLAEVFVKLVREELAKNPLLAAGDG